MFELAIVIVIVAILAALMIPVVSRLRARAQRVQCMANLKNLSLGTELYIQDNNHWPQITLAAADDASEADYAKAWIQTLAPYHVTSSNFICPTVQNGLGNPDYNQPANVRMDYFATAFDDKPTTPHEWPRQPWFAEYANVHGNGPLIIFTDGSISDLNAVVKRPGTK